MGGGSGRYLANSGPFSDISDDLTWREVAEILEERGFNSLSDILDAQGFSGLPNTMSEDEFNEYLNSGAIELARGIRAKDDEQYAEYINALLNGDFYVEGGEAYFGTGMYTFSGDNAYASASHYGIVTRMALAPDAKILTLDVSNGLSKDLKKYVSLAEGSASDLKSAGLPVAPYPDFTGDIDAFVAAENKMKTKNQKTAREHLKSTLSEKDYNTLYNHVNASSSSNEVLASKGYDAVVLTQDYVNENSNNGKKEICIVLNRTAVTVMTR